MIRIARMQRIWNQALMVCALGVCPVAWGQGFGEHAVASPGKQCELTLSWQETSGLTYRVKGLGNLLVKESALGYRLASGAVLPGAGWTLDEATHRSVRETWRPVWGKRAEVPDAYDEVKLRFRRAANATAGEASEPEVLVVTARAYDDGVAFSYSIPEGTQGTAECAQESTSFAFAGDYTAWFYNGEHHNLGPERLSEVAGRRLPVMTLRADDTHYLALHEADLREGEPLVLQSKKGETLVTVASRPAPLKAGFASAWRVLLVGATPGQAVDSHLLELLNPPPAEGMDFSWVRPGVALWDWRIDGAKWGDVSYAMDYPSWVRMIDFAAKAGFAHLVLDANWYGPEFDKSSDPTQGGKANDVRRIIAYGKSKGVGVWLYLNDVGGRRYPIEKTLQQYGEWGAAGVKYGFMRASPAEKNARTRYITELCARHHLLVDYHDGPVHPYGQMRTWPNAVTREYCHAQLDARRVFQPKTFVTSVFVNMVAGPLDMNNGMFDLRQGRTTRVDNSLEVPATLAAEAARTLITFSGATILPDIPEYYTRYPALLDFLSAQQMPWRESKTLAGAIGEYIVMLRQARDGTYLIGAATNEEARTLTLPLADILPEGDFILSLTEDGEGAHYKTNRETLRTQVRRVSRNDTLTLRLAPGGGACLTLRPYLP